MRNISLSDFKSYRVGDLDDCEVFCYDRQNLYVYSKGVIVKNTGQSENVICDLTQSLYPVDGTSDTLKAIELSYCFEKDFLFLVLLNGDIISVDLNNPGSEDIVGSVDAGIKAIQWSPEQELLALVTGNDTVVVMTKDFDTVSEVNLHGGGFGEKQFMSVGWGKKETQFRGSEGKYNARKEENEELLAEKNDQTRISWRGDAEYFAVSSVNPETQQRYLRIFKRSGELQYTSENVSGLESCLDWRPSGNLIASSQKLPNKYVICFFEKNGLRHGEFTLPSNEARVEQVSWNKDSKILAVFVVNPNNSPDKMIYLYTTSNYHWYCKYTITFDVDVSQILIQWDHQKHNTLHVVSVRNKQVTYSKYSWLWMINKSKGNTTEDESFVGVVDGCSLLLTPFNQGILPPPMCRYSLQTPLPINSVIFGPELNCNDISVQLSNGDVLMYKYVQTTEKVKHKLVRSLTGLKQADTFTYNLQWVADETFLLCLVKLNQKSQPYLLKLDIEPEGKYHTMEIPLMSTVAFMRTCVSEVVIHLTDGSLCTFSNNQLCLLYENDKHTFIECEVTKGENELYVFALDNLNKFYINNKVFWSNVLSFHIHKKFVLLTTLQSELLCVNFEEGIPRLNDSCEMFKRKVERGSRIVTVVCKDLRVVLQMPRGNLECIQPRALSLHVVAKHLDGLNYYEAFDLMRKQRINLNLLYDHNPTAFADNLNVFIDQIKDLQWVSLFLSDLVNEDVTKTMYPIIYKDSKSEGNGVRDSKVDLVCGMFERIFTERENSDQFLLPLLTCYIKRGKPEYLELALLKLKELKDKESKGIKTVVSFNEAFKFILYLVDVEELYKIALGMYDFDLVLIIAAKSQKDPKEYLSFLNELKQLEPNYQKFTIDKYLKRYKKALTNLIQCGRDDLFGECLSFIQTHRLHKFALKLIPPNTDRYKNVCISYGEELASNHLYEEAGMMFAKAGMYKNAIEAYRKCGNWQEVIDCARQLKLNENEVSELYLDLAMELSELKLFRESSVVYLEYLKDVEECVKTLVSGKLFAEAYRITQLHEQSHLIDGVIIPAAVEQEALTEQQISNFYETFTRQKNRLDVVRKQKKEVVENKVPFEECDLYSETNTIITQSSRSTNRSYRSAKNKRKHERKLLSLKEGSPYEDLALITSLHNVVTNSYQLKSEVKELNKFLVKVDKNELAEKLQEKLEQLLKVIEERKSEIWSPELLSSKSGYGPNSTSNDIAAMYNCDSVAPVLLNPKFAIPPENQDSGNKWQLEILSP